MAVIGTLSANFPSSVGWWAECTLAAAQAITGTSTATHTILYTNTSNRTFQPSLPLACIVLSPTTATSAAGSAYATLINGTNNLNAVGAGANQGIGISQVILGTTAQQTNTSTSLVSFSESGTLSLTFVNAGATGTLTAGTRLLFVQSNGN